MKNHDFITDLEIIDESKFIPGAKVHYVPEFGENENGIIKATRDGIAFVVYKCGGDWENYLNYTGQATAMEDLRLGWETIGDGSISYEEAAALGDPVANGLEQPRKPNHPYKVNEFHVPLTAQRITQYAWHAIKEVSFYESREGEKNDVFTSPHITCFFNLKPKPDLIP